MNDERITQWAQAYLHWLEPQVREEGHQSRTYSDLLSLMHAKEFVWLVPNDDNRIVDGLDVRREFLREAKTPNDLSIEAFGPVSVLEVLIGLSRRMAFVAEGSAEGWAWQFLGNLELHRMSDPLSRIEVAQVDDVLESLIWRTYNVDGTGGFFPLAKPEEDQTQVELWYQMCAYVEEIHPEY